MRVSVLEVERIARELDQQAKIVHPVGRDFPVGHDLRAAEEISLKAFVAFAEGNVEFLLVFHFFCQQDGTATARELDESAFVARRPTGGNRP